MKIDWDYIFEIFSNPDVSWGTKQATVLERYNTEKHNEYILCAAIHVNNNSIYKEQPNNIEKGFVVTGRRHSDCMNVLEMIGQNEPIESLIPGFLSSKNNFYDRKESYCIALKNDQMLHNLHDKSNLILTSECLYLDDEK